MAYYPWQHEIYQKLTDAFIQGRGHHALLFKTESGLGSEQLIRHFAHWLLCQNKQQNQPCLTCKSCLLFQSESHPDFHLLEPIDNRDIGVDQVREINQQLQQFSQQSGNVVVYVKGVDRLTEASANAILKTLEEPHQNTYFLLEAPLQSGVLATIQSRCQAWLCQAPHTEVALDWLKQECPDVPEEMLQTALHLCRHRPLFSKTFVKSDRLTARKSFMQTFWRCYTRKDPFLLLSVFDKEKDGALEQLSWLASFFSDAVKAKMGINSGWLNQDLHKGIALFSEALPLAKLLKGYQIVQQTECDLREINAVNQELMLANGLVSLMLDVFE